MEIDIRMKVLITVAEVAQVEDDFEIDGLEVDDRYLDYDLNEWDDYAIEAGVQIQEAGDDVKVVSVTIGPERSEETIRMALAKGADRAVRVWDKSLEEAAYLGSETKADVLAAVVEEEQPDLVLSGVQSGDSAFGATGVSLADEIGFEWAAVVNHLVYEAGAENASVHRELEGGVEELTDVELPAVLTIQTGINEPRYASLRGIRQAQSKEIAPKDLGDLGLDATVTESSLSLTEMYEPETESDATLFDGSPDEEADQLAEMLRDKGVVEG
jgi:electron transfer flavoprotein beta subunit